MYRSAEIRTGDLLNKGLEQCFPSRVPQKVIRCSMRSCSKYIKIFKYHEKFHIYLEVPQEFLSCHWQYWSKLCALFCFPICEHFYSQVFLKIGKIILCVSTWKKSWVILA
jgi:hypothetical protein